jgi:hypothetical protein
MAIECNQCGQGPCPTPQACELPIQHAEDEPLPSSFAFVIWMVVCIVILALVSFIAGLAAGYN